MSRGTGVEIILCHIPPPLSWFCQVQYSTASYPGGCGVTAGAAIRGPIPRIGLSASRLVFGLGQSALIYPSPTILALDVGTISAFTFFTAVAAFTVVSALILPTPFTPVSVSAAATMTFAFGSLLLRKQRLRVFRRRGNGCLGGSHLPPDFNCDKRFAEHVGGGKK
jgi:hypothetical protein